ncbi:MAG: single-stranded DNA-binding protein [Bdellovibrionales bacterium]|nr:single-stranded DNA-binding protein [Bdellovibrionales bacterium]MBT3525933.1 single-stranded DNA-binding protein [Bdellovibrionales bacterium]MBT7670594.1 single-stranded DNA-binding protein [Bdellovibrionales bacterium]MBT7765974.1 single-stranded DNA-binding protein [Bdellovibrionales bacterium]
MQNQSYELFMGRLGKNPDLRYTKKKEPVCYLSVAVNKDNSEKPDWKRVLVWGKQAEICNLKLTKGKEIFVQGRTNIREYQDDEGNKRSITEVNARLVGFSNL